MSRVLVIGINYAPENIGTGKYTSEMCEWLAEKGHEIRVITAPPYYPGWETWPEFQGRGYHLDKKSGVEILRCPIWVPKKLNGLTRILHLISFGLSSFVAIAYSAARKPDWVLNIAPTLTSAPSAWMLARLAGARCWLHIQDFEVDAAMDMGIVNPGRLRGAALAIERWLMRRFDVVSTISDQMLGLLAEKGVPCGQQLLIPNWADTVGITPLEHPSPYRKELGIPDDAVVALYSGNMNVKQGLDLLADAASCLANEKHIFFVFGGEGPARPLLERYCTRLPNVRFAALQPKERLREWLGLADIHLLPQRADVTDLVMPSKLTGMFASGRPIVATALPDSSVAAAIKDCGRITPPGDAEALAAALRELASNSETRIRLGRRARQHALSLTRDAVLETIEKRLVAVRT